MKLIDKIEDGIEARCENGIIEIRTLDDSESVFIHEDGIERLYNFIFNAKKIGLNAKINDD